MSDNLSPFEDPNVPREEPGTVRDAPREEARRQRHTHSGRQRDNWIGGAILILLGVVFLLNNAGIDLPFLDNWWAFFIFIPAVSSLNRAWSEIQNQGRLTNKSIGDLLGGAVLTLVAVTFLLGLSWSLMLPLLLIVGGLSILITTIAVNR